MKTVEKRTKSFFVHDGSSVDTEIVMINYRDITPESSNDCYDHYRKCGQKAAEIASAEVGYILLTNDICFDGEYPCYKTVVNSEGFTIEEYVSLTGQPVPNEWYDSFIDVGDNGKICSFGQQGNISAMRSGSSYVKNGTLITRVKTEIPVRISIFGRSEYLKNKWSIFLLKVGFAEMVMVTQSKQKNKIELETDLCWFPFLFSS